MHPTDSNLPWFLGNAGIDAYRDPDNYVVLDVETTNLDKGSAVEQENDLVLACWYIVDRKNGTQKKYKFGDEYNQEELYKDVVNAQFVVAHNAKFELQWLKRMGVDLRTVLVFDTYLAEWVIGGNRYKQQALSLNAAARRHGLGTKRNTVATMIHGGVCPSQIPAHWLLDYCFQDVDLSHELFLKQRKVIESLDLWHIVLTRCLTAPVLADMEFAGCQLDVDKVEARYKKILEDYRRTEKELQELAEGKKLRGKQLAELLYDILKFSPPTDQKTGKIIRTEKGALATNQLVMAKLVAKTDKQKKFLELYNAHNKLHSLITKNMEFFAQVCKYKKGLFYGSITQGATGTHRLASNGKKLKLGEWKTPRGPQLQNLPRALKDIFTALGDDYLIGEADGAQLEFRVAADLGNDLVATKEIENQVDIHSVTAKTLYEANDPEFVNTPKEFHRQLAKAHTFRPLYGGKGKTPATKAYAKFFSEKYNAIASTQEGWTYEVLNKGYLVTPYGMRFYWPNTTISRTGYIDNTQDIYNYPVQGFATAEIIPIALIHFWHRIKGLDIVVWNTVHDSIASRIHKDIVPLYEELSKIALTTDVYRFLDSVYNYEFKVPLGVGIKVAKHWGDTKLEKIWSVWPDGREEYKENS